VSLARANEVNSGFFILDDGFQYRKLARDLDIVVVAAREFYARRDLIPASLFREPFTSLKRAGIVVVTHKHELESPAQARLFLARFTSAPIFFADYRPVGVTSFEGTEYTLSQLTSLNIAAVTAIGYPRGFFLKLKEFGVMVKEEIIYPDHHELNFSQGQELLARLKKGCISHIITTAKDKNRFGIIKDEVKILVLDVSLFLEEEDNFVALVKSKITGGKWLTT
jgi:tetraacyldisaccharide 4'-kinase